MQTKVIRTPVKKFHPVKIEILCELEVEFLDLLDFFSNGSCRVETKRKLAKLCSQMRVELI